MNEFVGRKIKQITIITQPGVAIYEIGTDGIEKIEDHSSEFEDSVFSSYWGLDKEGKVLKVIENCPVDITYVKGEPK